MGSEGRRLSPYLQSREALQDHVQRLLIPMNQVGTPIIPISVCTYL